ncbi:MAG: putative glycoside hydrolase [Gemmatirosa sp.]
MRDLVALADSTEINALVIDMKDEFGLNYRSETPAFAENAGETAKLRDVRALTDSLRAHGILPIARLVVFKDSVTARVHPQWTIRRPDGAIWRDHKGLAWVDPHNRALWDYNIGVAEEMARLGFGEIQFDYIRFPEPYASLPRQVFPGDKGQSKPDAITEFLKVANARLDRLGVRTTADIFGLVTTVAGPLEVAQHWERLSPVTDVLLPMVYPSHYPRGSLGVARPNAEPYQIVFRAIRRARARRGDRHHEPRERAPLPAGVQPREARLWGRGGAAAEAGRLRRGVRRVGALASRLEVRAVRVRAGTRAAGLAEEDAVTRTDSMGPLHSSVITLNVVPCP